MKYSLLILAAPDSPGNYQAYCFAKALLAAGHEIYRLFFYHQGVYSGNQLVATPQDELNLPAMWQSLCETEQLDAVVCIASAIRRGVLNSTEAERQQKPAANLANGFDLSGLGQWADALSHSDRIISFAP